MTSLPNFSELTPRRGRDYASGAKAKLAFLQGRDFVYAATGQTTSLRDGVITPGTTVLLRFKRLTGVTSVKVTQKMIDNALEVPLSVLSAADPYTTATPGLPAYDAAMRSIFS
jgi:hypothetical protein